MSEKMNVGNEPVPSQEKDVVLYVMSEDIVKLLSDNLSEEILEKLRVKEGRKVALRIDKPGETARLYSTWWNGGFAPIDTGLRLDDLKSKLGDSIQKTEEGTTGMEMTND